MPEQQDPISEAAASLLSITPPSFSDAWTWRAIYPDGSFLDEYDEQGGHHGFAEVDLEHISIFVLLPTREGLPTHHVLIDAASGQRPIFFRRRTLSVNPLTEAVEGSQTIHVLGWQRTIQGQNIASYSFIYEDGSVLLSDDYQAV